MPDIFTGKEEDRPKSEEALPAHHIKKETQALAQEAVPLPHHKDEYRKSPEDSAPMQPRKVVPTHREEVGLFSAFCHQPYGITFANQEAGETVLLFIRRHFATNLSWILLTAILLCLPLLLLVLPQIFDFSFIPFPRNFGLMLLCFYYLIVFGYAFTNFISWFYNVGIITSKRIIDLDSSNILSQSTAVTSLTDVVDIDYHQKGFLQSIFNYGDVMIQTQALKENFEFIATPQPSKISDIISDRIVAIKGEKNT